MLASACHRQTSPPGRPNVVLIVLDTTRVDRLSVYGYERPTAPNLEAFARDAIRFDRAYSTSTWTLAAHASLFTGLLPTTHQATQENLRLDRELDTLAELLGAAGYETAAFTNNSWISVVTELAQGFDHLSAMWREHVRVDPSGLPHPTNEAIAEWLARRDPNRPFFLFVNYMEAHWPLRPPLSYWKQATGSADGYDHAKVGNFAAISWYLSEGKLSPAAVSARSDLYDAELAYLDAVVGDLLSLLRKNDVLENSLVVITADHGENLGEHGHQGHSFALYDQTVHVPLLIRTAGARGASVREDPVHLPDVFSTIVAYAGVEAGDPRIVGSDLLAGPLPEDRPLVAEYYYPKTFLGRFPANEKAAAATAPFRRRIRAIRIGADKLVWGSDGRNELYDTRVDPGETDNLIERRPERARALEATLDGIVTRLARPIHDRMPPLSEMDEETIANLRALGYIP